MKTREALRLLAASTGGAIFAPSALAQGGAPSATEILRLVRYSQAANEQDFKGGIRRRKVTGKVIPLKITMSAKEVRFVFYEGNSSKNKPDQILILSLFNNRYKLEEIIAGKRSDLAAKRFAEHVRGTDITYEDLAMRFLYWPNPRHVGVERAKGGDAWKIHCVNPVKDGAYAAVDVWVSKESGALVKMNGFNAAGKIVKSFEVAKVEKYKGAWILEQMIVRTHPVKSGERLTTSYLEMTPPKR